MLALADALIELKAVCECGRKATMNLRVDAEGHAVAAGDQTEIGGNDRYVALCRRHFFERLREREGPELARVRIMTGHFPLGLRKYLPAGRELRLFTFLREPRERTLSHFYAIREAGARRRGETEASSGQAATEPSFACTHTALPPPPTRARSADAGSALSNTRRRVSRRSIAAGKSVARRGAPNVV